MQDSEILNYYQRCWTRMLVLFLNWPQARAERWARLEIDLHRDDRLLNHEWPAYYLAPYLLPAHLPEATQAIGEIGLAIYGGGPDAPDLLDEAYDCETAKARLRLVLQKYGLDLHALDVSRLQERWPL